MKQSMVENLLEHDNRREIDLYWGARNADELYLDDLPARWASEYEHIRYHRALSDPDADANADFEAYFGLVHEAVAKNHPDLSGYDVYMSGPPIMVHSGRTAFEAVGLTMDHMFSDAFEYAAASESRGSAGS